MWTYHLWDHNTGDYVLYSFRTVMSVRVDIEYLSPRGYKNNTDLYKYPDVLFNFPLKNLLIYNRFPHYIDPSSYSRKSLISSHFSRPSPPFPSKELSLRTRLIQSIIVRPLVSLKSDWLVKQRENEYTAQVQKIGSGQRSWFLVLTKRIADSGAENL